jgi:RHS repeat-associated protein
LPGQYCDRETGLYYNRHRYYDPKIGSYVNQDPIRWRGGINYYSYPVNPTARKDPLGLDATATQLGQEITIDVNIGLQGVQATPVLAAQWQNSINSIWNAKKWKYRNCTVRINAIVNPGISPQNNINLGDSGRSYVDRVGGNSGTWYADNDPWVPAHEVGHLMGLDDRYKDNKEGISIPDPGWENNIMGSFGAPVEQRNIDEIVEKNLDGLGKALCGC